MSEGFERRPIKRGGYCRGCDIKVQKGTDIIYTYTSRNRGQSIIICLDCATEIQQLLEKGNDTSNA